MLYLRHETMPFYMVLDLNGYRIQSRHHLLLLCHQDSTMSPFSVLQLAYLWNKRKKIKEREKKCLYMSEYFTLV